MNPIRNCRRLLNKLRGTVEQRDIFASGITQRRPRTSICAKPGFVIVFHSKHFSRYFTAQSTPITQPNFNQNATLANTTRKGNLTILFYFFFLERMITGNPPLSRKSSPLRSPIPLFPKSHLRLPRGPQRLNVVTELTSTRLTSLRP